MPRFRRADWIVVALAASLVGAVAVAVWAPDDPAHSVEIRGPQGLRTLSLDTDRSIEFAGFIGVSSIVIDAGRVRFSAAPCRQRVCIAAGWLDRTGDFAACVPNGVSVRLVGDDDYDAINY